MVLLKTDVIYYLEQRIKERLNIIQVANAELNVYRNMLKDVETFKE